MGTCLSAFKEPPGLQGPLRNLHLTPDTKPFTGVCSRKLFLSSGLPGTGDLFHLPYPGPQTTPPTTLSVPTSGPGRHGCGSLANGPGGSSLSRPSLACLRGPQLIKSAPSSPPGTVPLIIRAGLRKVTRSGLEKGAHPAWGTPGKGRGWS